MKKVGILTFHRAVNYGACLQAYALKNYIEAQGCQCDIIDYHCSAVEDFYNKIFLREDSIKTKIKKIITWPIQKKRNEIFKDFIESKLLNGNKTDEYTRRDISKANELYDLFIVGSDQVWSPFCTGGDLTYFLDFVNAPHKRNSYAACVGVASDDFLKSKAVLNNLLKFNNISVREECAQKKLNAIIFNQAGKRISLDVDPTLLLDTSKWNEVAGNGKKEHYIFVYSLSMPDEVVKFAKRLAKEQHEKIIFCTLDNLFTLRNRNDTVNVSPEEFLGYIKDADYVITNSFHGTVFSIIFRKNFYVIKNKNPNHDNSRMVNILSLLGVENRLIQGDCMPNTLEDIDYSCVEHKLTTMRDSSREYICKMLLE